MQVPFAIFSISKPDIQHQVGAQEMDLDEASMALLLHLFGIRYIFYIVLVQHELQECSWLGFPDTSTQLMRIQAALRCKTWNQLDRDRKLLILPYLGAAFAQQKLSQLESNLVTRVMLGWSWGTWINYLYQ